MAKTVGAAVFKATCLKLIDEMQKDGEPVTITKRGKVIAIMKPVETNTTNRGLVGALRHPAYRFDDPFSPVTDPDDWDANR